MKKRSALKKLSVLVISMLLLTVCLCACSSGTKGGSSKIAGKTESWGNLTVLVPDGMKLVGGDLLDEKNEDALMIQDEKDVLKYINVSINDESSIDSGLEWTKELNEGCKDVELKLDNGTFTGFAYKSYDYDCVMLKGKIGDKFVQIGSAGFTSDSDILTGVLASVVLK